MKSRSPAAGLCGRALVALIALQQAAAQGSNQAAGQDFIRACLRDYRSFCRDVPTGGGQVLACLQAHESSLSQGCRTALSELNNELAARASAKVDTGALPAGTRIVEDVAYGRDAAQKLDVYAPAKAQDAPIIVMLHGGAWAFGDKGLKSVVQAKVQHWLPEGFIFISVNTRLIPAADPLEQAADMARALAAIQARARAWGGDPTRIVLMGHSAGAHIVALLAAAPEIAAKAGATPWRGTVVLDSAALNVPQTMASQHLPLYDKAFGGDGNFWTEASPYQRLTKATAPMLIVCSTRRPDPCPQAGAFADKYRSLGGRTQILKEDRSHSEINAQLGEKNSYTAAVDDFLGSLGMRQRQD